MPKVLIDIPEQYLKLIHSDSPINCVSMSGFLNFVRNGIVFDNYSNRELLEKLFDAQVLFQWDLEDTCGTLIHIGGKDVVLDREWCKRKWGE